MSTTKKEAPKTAAGAKKAAPKRNKVPKPEGYAFMGDTDEDIEAMRQASKDGTLDMAKDLIEGMMPIIDPMVSSRRDSDARAAMYAMLNNGTAVEQYQDLARKAFAMADAMAQVRKETEG